MYLLFLLLLLLLFQLLLVLLLPLLLLFLLLLLLLLLIDVVADRAVDAAAVPAADAVAVAIVADAGQGLIHPYTSFHWETQRDSMLASAAVCMTHLSVSHMTQSVKMSWKAA